jgi:predicted N-acyltransferase
MPAARETDPMTADDLTLSAVAGVASLDRAKWNRCAGNALPGRPDSFSQAARRCGEEADSFSQQSAASFLNRFANHRAPSAESYSQLTPNNPFVSHDFLSILERSGCVGGRTGWRPLPLVAERGAEIVGVAPAYLKAHSQGEYVFDHGWADAYERAGGRYYPKLQIAVPFTPAAGPRLLAADEATRAALADGLIALAAQTGASSVHVTFPTQAEAEALAARGWLLRLGEQYHFRNEGYRDYEDFLATLASRKRKALKRERREALASGVEIEWLTGAALTEAHWDAFFAFYMDTGSRKWGRPYLNRAFFSLLGEAMADRVLLVMARRGGRYVAGALNLIGGDALYGRYWGAVEETPFLHFELCYHQAIDYALAHGLSRVEAGAQGEHKLARGYRPTPTWSAHHIADPGLRRAVSDYLKRERAMMREAIAQDDAASPFRKSPQTAQDVATIRVDGDE